MATAPTGVKVGSAFIDITPVMDQAELSRQLEKFEASVKKEYKRASDVTQAYARLRVELEKWVTTQYGDQAKGRLAIAESTLKAQTALQKTESAVILKALADVEKAELASERRKQAAKQAATRRKQRIALNARDLEIKYGQQVADDYLNQIKKMQAGKKKLTLTQINETKRWAELEQAEIRKVAAAQRQADQQAIRSAQLKATKATEAAKRATAAYTAAYETERSQQLRAMQLDQMRTRARIEGELAVRQAALATAAAQSAAAAQVLRTIQDTAKKAEKSWTKSTYRMGSSFNAVGTSMAEFGRSVQRNVTTPLITAAAAASAMGISAADSLMRAQTALQGMGVNAKDVTKQIEVLEKYGTQTPYAVGDMFTYGAQFTRSGMSHGMSSSKASTRATDLVMSIGDLAAYAGITDPEMVKRTLVAVGNIQEADRASLRNVRTLAQSAGFDVQQLAQVLGFKDREFTAKELAARKKMMDEKGVSWDAPKINKASAQMMDWMQNAKDTGGIPGESIVTAIIDQAKKVAGTGEGGKESAAITQGSATVGARLSNMWESAKFSLADLFVQPKGKDGAYVYDGAGEAIMGKRTPVMVKGPDNTMVPSGEFTYEGGLLETITEIGKVFKGPTGKAVTELFEGLNTFAGWVKETVQYLKDNPGLTDMILEAGKWAVLLAGGAIVLGSVIKMLGAILKLGSPLVGLTKGAFKAARGGTRVASQTARGLQAASMGDSYRDAYRAQRGANRDGDTRSVFRRGIDRVQGRNSQAERLTLDISQYEEQMQKAKESIADLNRQVRDLNRKNLNKLAQEAAGKDSSVQAAAQKAEKATAKAAKAVANLNSQKLKSLKGQITGNTGAANNLGGATGQATGKIKTLKGQSLKGLKGQFNNVKDAADAAYKKASSLTSEVKTLNGKKLDKVTGHVKDLGKALKDAGGNAKKLNDYLGKISKHAPGGGSGSGKKNSKALGGVLPGYTPGRDVHVFTSPTAGMLELSGGESVMRPEWTAAVGPDTVNRWNHVARTRGASGLRQEMKFANGGIIEKLGLGSLVEGAKNFQVGGDVRAAAQTMVMDSSSRPLGGDVQKGIIGAGTDGSHFIGGDLAKRFKGIYDFVTKGSWDLLKRLPIPNGLTQIVGTIGGAVAPTASEYFWDDVWKGHGNILERGYRFMDHMFSMDTLKDVASDLLGGAWDSVSGLWDTATSLVTDPIDTISDTIDGVVAMARSQYTGVVDMVKGIREIWQSPKDYAAQVIGDIYTTAKESLPNLEGIFDFSGDGLSSSSKAADIEKALQAQMSTPGVGDAVTRWTPQVRMVLSQLGLPQSDLALVLHRIQVESGGNPKAINLWDSNAKAGYPSQGLMQTIPQTFAAYAGPYKSRGITDPLASIYAGLNYATSRYGSGWRKALSGVKGYATGTDGAERGWAWVGEEGPELVNFSGGETVLTHEESMLTGMKVLRGYASGTTKRTTGIAADAAKGVSSLNSAVKKLYDLITKAFTSGKIGSGTASSLNKYVDSQNKKLQKLVKDRTTLATKLKDANAKLDAIKKDETEMSTSISDNAKGLRSLTDVFNSNGVSTSSAISSLKGRLAAIKSFQSNINTLVKRGFSKEIIAEIAQAGPEQGGAMAAELLNATKDQVSEFNKVYSDIGKASDSLGKSVSSSYYKAGKDAATAMVKGLTGKDKALTRQIEKLADSIIKTFKKKLKVSSKTPVNSSMASLLTWLTGTGQAVTGGGNTSKKKSTRVTTSYSTDSKGRKVTTVTTTVTDPAKGTTTTTTERTVGGKTTKSTKVSKIKGYWTGTRSASPGVALVGERGPELVNFRGGESVRNAKDTAELMGPRYEIHIHEAKSENTTQSVLRAMQYAEVMANM